MSGRLLGVVAIVSSAACGVTIETEEERPSIEEELALDSAACPPRSQLAFAERFSDETGSWPAAWVLSATGRPPRTPRAGALEADPGATARATMEAPLDVASLRLSFSFEPGASQELVVGLFGSRGRTAPPFDGAGLDLIVSHDTDGEVAWALHREDFLAALPDPAAIASRAVLEARVTRNARRARVDLSLSAEGHPPTRRRFGIDVEDLESLGPLTIAAVNRGETHRPAALRVHEIVVCTAVP